MARAKTIVSAGVVLYLNGKPYGRVIHFQWNSSTARKAQYGLDCMEPFELQPTITRCTGRIGIVRTIADAGIEGAAMAARYEELPREKYFTVQLVEKASDTVLFDATYCSVSQQSWSAPEKGKVTGEVEFEALDWSNELRPLRP